MNKFDNITRENPPVMPMGFRVGVSDDVVIVDLLDRPALDETKIFFTMVLNRASAKSLASSLMAFINESS